MIRVLGTRSNKLASHLIRANTKEEISHVAILLDWETVIHSNFKGVQILSIEEFINEGNEVMTIVDITNEEYCENFIKNSQKFNDRKFFYDYFAIAYLGLKYLLGHINIKLPKKNLWQVSSMYMCTEFVTYTLKGKENSLITPGQLINLLKEEEGI